MTTVLLTGFEPFDHDAPAGCFATLPVKAIVRDISAAGIPATLSHTAGTFVCNAVFFRAAVDAGRRSTRAGFIHVPWATGQSRSTDPHLPIEEIAEALRIAIRTTVATPSDIPAPGGTLH